MVVVLGAVTEGVGVVVVDVGFNAKSIVLVFFHNIPVTHQLYNVAVTVVKVVGQLTFAACAAATTRPKASSHYLEK